MFPAFCSLATMLALSVIINTAFAALDDVALSVEGIDEDKDAHGNHSWGFGPDNGPSTWGGLCKNGTRQSPINIITINCRRSSFGKLLFENYESSGAIELYNGGHGVVVRGFANWEGRRPSISGGGLGSKYVLEQLHIHWSNDHKGSEHTINGSPFAAELHMVHVKQGLTLAQALELTDGLAVIGVLYKRSSKGKSLSGIQNALKQVAKFDSTAHLSDYKMSVNLPANPHVFYRYNGSLTTPDCHESVVWTVLANTLTITADQLSVFRSIKASDAKLMTGNIRPTQPTNGRIVQVQGN